MTTIILNIDVPPLHDLKLQKRREFKTKNSQPRHDAIIPTEGGLARLKFFTIQTSLDRGE